jgi:hypothetical protein
MSDTNDTPQPVMQVPPVNPANLVVEQPVTDTRPPVSDVMTGQMTEPKEDPDVRPWHGHENPLEAMYQYFKAEIAKLKGGDK